MFGFVFALVLSCSLFSVQASAAESVEPLEVETASSDEFDLIDAYEDNLTGDSEGLETSVVDSASGSTHDKTSMSTQDDALSAEDGTIVGGESVEGDNSVIVQEVADNTATVEALEAISEQLDVVTTALEVETTVNSYQVSDYYREYFKGVLQNMPYTEYLCYAKRISTTSSSYNYITHYYLFYDLKIEDGHVVAGSYPCIDVYAQDNVYYMTQTTKAFEGYPTIGFASFAPYSALIDRSFHYNDLYVGIICCLAFFLLGRKTVFS